MLAARTLGISALSLGLFAACLPKRVTIDGRDMTEREGAEYLFAEGMAAERRGDLATAKERYKELVDRFPADSAAPDALAHLGAVLKPAGCAAASHYLEQLVADHPDHPDAAAAKAELERCRGAAEVPVDPAMAGLRERFERAGDAGEKAKIAAEAKATALAAQDYRAAVEWILALRGLDPAAAKTLDAELLEIVDQKASFQEIRGLYEALDGDEPPKDLLTYKLGRIQYHVRDYENARTMLEDVRKRWPSSPYAAGAAQLLERIAARGQLSPTTIGVLLPLSGPLKGYGERALEAVRLAMGELDGAKDQAVTMVVRDSGGDPVKSAKAMQDLVLVDGAIAVVGALFRKEAEAAAVQAQALGVPLLTLSAQEDVVEVGPYVFRSGLTNAAQMDALVGYAMDVLGHKRFAVLYPRHPYGEDLLRRFWARVEAKGGEIRGVEAYGARDTTFTGPVRRLVGRYDVELRADFKRAKEECQKIEEPYRRDKCLREFVKNLEPVIDFDALFIPDYPSSVTLIAPALAVEDIVVERNPRYLKKIEQTLGRKITPVTLLGASGWNSRELPEKAGRYVENAIFTDGFFDGADDEVSRTFVTRFRKELKRPPGLPEAMFYDSMLLLKDVIVREAPKSREDMRQALRRVHGFAGVTGKLSFRDGPDVVRTVKILTFQNGEIKEAPPPVEAAPTVP